MKKSTVLIIILLLTIIYGIIFYSYHIKNSKKELEATLKNANEVFELNKRISELEEQISNEQYSNISKEEVKFDSNKMKLYSEGTDYSEDTYDRGSVGLEIEIKEGKPYISTNTNNEDYKMLFPKITEAIKDKEITGFDSKVIDVHYSFIGNGDVPPIILFLMEDGTVEFLNSDKMLEKKEFSSSGKIKELSNIVKFVNLKVYDIENKGGYATTGVIDEAGYTYDISLTKDITEILKL